MFIVFVFLHIICYDLWFYISHILLHHHSFYHIHKSHHIIQSTQLKYPDALEGHWIESTIQPLGIFVPNLLITGFSFQSYPLFISLLIVGLRSLMRHDNRCSWIIGNHHILHHKNRRYNYGEYWIDTLFGTAYPDKTHYIYGKIYT